MADPPAHQLEIRSRLSPDECVRRIADSLTRPKVLLNKNDVTILQDPSIKGSANRESITLSYNQPSVESPTFFEGTISPAPGGGSIIRGTLSTSRGSRFTYNFIRYIIGAFSLLMLCVAGLLILQNGMILELVLFIFITLLFAACMFTSVKFIASPTPARISDFIREALKQ
jgi:hypothetical protein